MTKIKDASPLSSNQVGTANVAGTRFANISNPYSSLPRERTNLDKLLNWLGFRSGYDKAQEQYNLAGAEYNAQLEQLASEEQYNSPVEQASRMRAAGLNPDLTGVSGEPASEFDNQQQSPDVSAGTDINPFDIVSSIGQGFMSTLTGTIGLLNSLNGYQQNRLSLDMKDLEYQKSMLDFFKESDSLFHSPSDSRGTDSLNPSLTVYNAGQGFFRSSRNLKRFNRLRSKASDSLLGLTTSYKSYDEFAKASETLGSSMSKPWFSGFGSLTPKDVADVLKPLSEAQLSLMFEQIKADSAKAWKDQEQGTFEANTYSSLNDPNHTGKVEWTNAEKNAAAMISDMDTKIAENDARRSIAPMTVTKNRILNHMVSAIDDIPDRNLGTTILKYFLINQLSGSLVSEAVPNALGALGKALLP